MATSTPPTERLTQIFRNTTDQAQFINLELSTFRYRLQPGHELMLFYDPSESLEIQLAMNGERMELFVWTGAMEMFHSDGREAELDYEP